MVVETGAFKTLERIIVWRGKPKTRRCNNVSQRQKNWAEKRKIALEYIQLGNPQQNAYIERYNRTVRYDWLNQHLFETIEEVLGYATKWLWVYKNEHPHTSLAGTRQDSKCPLWPLEGLRKLKGDK